MKSLGVILLVFIGCVRAAQEPAKCMIRVAEYDKVNVIPETYNVSVKTEFKTQGFFSRIIGKKAKQEFSGNVTMRFSARKAAKNMTMHSLNLELSNAEYRQLPTGEWKKLQITTQPDNQTATFILEAGIPTGPGEFRCSFKGKMQFGLSELGVQILNQTDMQGQQSAGFISHMIPEGARRVFPCVDFPKYKAKFTLTMVVPNNLAPISNTEPVSEKALDKDYKSVTFAETPEMSTFSLAFVVGKYHVSERNIGGVKVRIHVNHRHKAHYANIQRALDAIEEALPAIQQYTGTPIGGKKLDVIAVHESIRTVSTAGLVIMPDDILLSLSRPYTQQDSESADPEVRLKGHMTYALCKIWFGSNITMEYWDNIWMSEGISTFLSELINGKLYPPQEQWIKYDRSSVKRLNTLETANDSPAKFSFYEPDFVVFSGLVKLATQTKASLYLWMLYKHIEDDLFKKSLKLFVSRHSGSFVKSEDFSKDFQEASGFSMDWFNQIINFRGMVTLHVDCEQSSSNRVFKIHQIYYRKGSLPCPRNDSVWSFPLFFDSEEGKTHKTFIDSAETSVSFPGIPWKTKWAKINQLSSYFRVLYSENCYENYGLYRGLGTGAISGQEKGMIRDDVTYLENLYRRVVVRPDELTAANITDNYNFVKVKNTLLDIFTPPQTTTNTTPKYAR